MPEASLKPSDESDRRSHDRQTMILRVGLLEQAGKPSFCLVRNLASTGVQVKLYSPARVGDVLVRVADENPIAGQIVWVRSSNAGIRFEESVDPAALLRLQQKLGPVRRRSMPRVKATSYALMRVGGRMVSAVLQDISSMGARVTTSRSMEVGAMAIIRLPDLPELRAHVRWTEESESGLVFETPIPMHVIAEWIDGRLRVAI